MQQRGCPALPQHILEWQTPHLAKPPPEEEDDQDLDEEAAEAKQQEARLAVGEGLLGDLALARTKRELSPSASEDLDEPDTKKQKVSWFQCQTRHVLMQVILIVPKGFIFFVRVKSLGLIVIV